jgi:hypothetical protein
VQLRRHLMQRAIVAAYAGALLPRHRLVLLGAGQPGQLAKQVDSFCSTCVGGSAASAQSLKCMRQLRGLGKVM